MTHEEAKQSMREFVARLDSGWGVEWTVSDPSRGLGDTIAKATSALGITPCGGCKERQAKLNRIVPYRSKQHAH